MRDLQREIYFKYLDYLNKVLDLELEKISVLKSLRKDTHTEEETAYLENTIQDALSDEAIARKEFEQLYGVIKRRFLNG